MVEQGKTVQLVGCITDLPLLMSFKAGHMGIGGLNVLPLSTGKEEPADVVMRN